MYDLIVNIYLAQPNNLLKNTLLNINTQSYGAVGDWCGVCLPANANNVCVCVCLASKKQMLYAQAYDTDWTSKGICGSIWILSDAILLLRPLLLVRWGARMKVNQAEQPLWYGGDDAICTLLYTLRYPERCAKRAELLNRGAHQHVKSSERICFWLGIKVNLRIVLMIWHVLCVCVWVVYIYSIIVTSIIYE